MTSIIQKKIATLRDELLGNNTEMTVIKRIECSDEENNTYEALRSGGYPRPLPDEVFEDADRRGKYYKKVTEHISFGPPTESEIDELMKLTQLHYEKESAEHLRIIRSLLAWTAFVVTLFAGIASCCYAYLYVKAENTNGVVVSLLFSIIMFVLSVAAIKCRAKQPITSEELD